MKKQIYLTALAFITIFVMALSACAPAAGVPAVQAGGAGKAQAAPVEFTGVIEAMNDNQWTISGQVVIVDPSILNGASFAVGDTVKVEGQVGADGLLTASQVEQSVGGVNDNANANDNGSADDNANDNGSADDNANDNGSADDNANDNGSADDNANDNGSADDNANDNGSDDDNGNANDNSSDDDDDGSGGGGGGGSDDDDDGSGGGGGGGSDDDGDGSGGGSDDNDD